jgi:hypothetical protein
MNFFSHSGDIGDIIYSLPAIKAANGGELILFNYPGRTYQQMTYERYQSLKNLLEYQPYIFKTSFSKTHADSSLNGFRDHQRHGENTSDWHLSTQGLDWTHRVKPWLSVPEPLFRYKVLVAWTPRHHSFDFPWKEVHDKYKHDIGFLGYKDYYNKFISEYEINSSSLGYVDSKDFLEMAQVIEGCDLYIGNLTSMTAIAEGLKKKVIIEGYHPCSANHFIRHNSIIAYTHRIEL